MKHEEIKVIDFLIKQPNFGVHNCCAKSIQSTFYIFYHTICIPMSNRILNV